MSEAKHTPGPWHECKAGQCTCGIIWSIPGDFPVCTVAGGSTFPVAVAHEHMADGPDDIYQSISPDTAEANALLIAAAPDLLAALKLFVEGFDPKDGSHTGSAFADKALHALAAIAKAEGKSDA